MRLTALAFTILAAPVAAQNLPCGDHAAIAFNLSERYGERVVFTALDSRGVVVEIWLNGESGSWSALAVSPSGQACFIGVGPHFVVVAPEPEGVDG